MLDDRGDVLARFEARHDAGDETRLGSGKDLRARPIRVAKRDRPGQSLVRGGINIYWKGLTGPTFFVLGAFVTPPFQMPDWRERGVNTIIGVGARIDDEEHHGMARELALVQIRPPFRDRLLRDLADPP